MELQDKPRHAWADQIVENIFDVVLITDERRVIQDTNAAVTQLGYTEDGLRGQSANLLVADTSNLDACYANAAIGAAQVELRRFLVREKGGNELWFDVGTRIIENGQRYFLLVMHNVHDRALARKALEEQNAKIEQALAETEALRREAEQSKSQLQVANEQLAKRQELTEQQLIQEREFRIQQNRFGIQQRLATMLVFLIGGSILMPYLFRLFYVVDQNMSNSTGNALLLLINGLMIIVGGLFARRQNDKKDGEDQ